MSTYINGVSGGGSSVTVPNAAVEYYVAQAANETAIVADIPTVTNTAYQMQIKIIGTEDTVETSYGPLSSNPTGDGTAVATLTLANIPVDPGSVVITDGQVEVLSTIGEIKTGGGPLTQFTKTLTNGVSLVPGSVVITDTKNTVTTSEDEPHSPTGGGTAILSFTTTYIPYGVGEDPFVVVDNQASPTTWTFVGEGLQPSGGTVAGVSGTVNDDTGEVVLTYANSSVVVTTVLASYYRVASDPEVWTDNGVGGLVPAATGINVGTTGTIDYNTRVAVMNYTSAAQPTQFSADYDYNSTDQLTWTDTGNGTLTPSGSPAIAGVSATINYTTGVVALTYAGNIDLDSVTTNFRSLTTGTRSASYIYIVKAHNKAGTLTIGSLTNTHLSEDHANFSVSIAVNGTNVRVSAASPADSNTFWNASVETVAVSFDGA